MAETVEVRQGQARVTRGVSVIAGWEDTGQGGSPLGITDLGGLTRKISFPLILRGSDTLTSC